MSLFYLINLKVICPSRDCQQLCILRLNKPNLYHCMLSCVIYNGMYLKSKLNILLYERYFY